MSLPADPFGRVHAPTREGAVAALLAAADELVVDERPALRRLGNALRAWLLGDAPSLESALGVATPRGSHRTAKSLARAHRR